MESDMTRAPPPALRGFAVACLLLAGLGGLALAPATASASEASVKVERDYADHPPAPANQHPSAAEEKSAGCMSCHTDTDSKTMHANPGVVLGCTDCHGGDASVFASGDEEQWSDAYYSVFERAHVLPQYPDDWHYPRSSNPKQSYTLLNR
jgi:hypothetical protein